jgi:allantoinase
VLPTGVQEATVLLDGGLIAEIVRGPQRVAGAIDLGERVIGPGLVDCHVHINEPGRTEWEGFETATRAAAAGGVTTLIDMPLNCTPVTTERAALELKCAASEGKRFVDLGFWGGVVPGNASELEGLVKEGARGFKAFMCYSGVEEFPGVLEEHLTPAMLELKRLLPYYSTHTLEIR